MIQKIELSAALNSLATQTNIDKVTGMLGSSAANITKADLATVVAGLFGTALPVAFDIGAGETIYTDMTGYCLLKFSVYSNGEEALILFGHNAIPILVATSLTKSNISITDTPGKVCIYKEADGGQIIIKNNYESRRVGSYRVL